MTKAELIEMLNEWPDDVVIGVASDSEGNTYRRLTDWGVLWVDDPDAYEFNHVSNIGDDEEPEDLTKILVLYP